MKTPAPLVVIIAGPNGAGKSTIAPRLLQGALAVREFVNADVIAQGLSAFQPESVAVAAGRIMLNRLRTLGEAGEDFAFETTLAGRNFVPWLESLRQSGYRAHLVFIALASPDLAVARVKRRVILGGHDVPEEVVRRRYQRGLANFFGAYQSVVDSWQLFDNTNHQAPRLIAERQAGAEITVRDPDLWQSLRNQV